MPCVSLQKKSRKFQEEASDLEARLLELGFLCENPDDRVDTLGGHKELLENRYCPGNMGMEVVNRLRDKLNMNKPQLQK